MKEHPLTDSKQAFLAQLEFQKRLAPSSLALYRLELERFFALCPRPQIENFLEDLKKQSPPTARRKLSILRSFLKDCPEPWRDLLHSVQGPKLRKKQPAFLTDQELFQLESAAYRSKTSSRDRLFVAFGAQVGLRLSEILSLRFMDVEKDWLRVIRKGGKEQRLPLTKSLQSLIHFYKKERLSQDQDWIFESQPGKALSSRGAQKLLARLAQEAKLSKKITPHALRHSFATKLASEGVSLSVVKEFLGHERLTTTERYLHVTPEYLKRALGAIDRFSGEA